MNKAMTQNETPLPTTPEHLFERLTRLGIEYGLHHHKAVYTVAESSALDRDIPGTPCRNLFLRDKKKRNYLLTLRNETAVDLQKLAPAIGSQRLSFGSAERLWQYLGVRPGSVCPFAIVNDPDRNVRLLLDKSMMEADLVAYHPLLNTMTLTLKPYDLLRFAEDCGHEPEIVDLSPAAP